MKSNIQSKSYIFKGSHQKLITADLTFSSYTESVPIVLFVHGFKGFKDWGAWPLAAEIFSIKGLPFFKFNFSHNGTTPEQLTEFVDLETFGNNNFKIEFDELGFVMDFIEKKSNYIPFDWNGEFFVIGHSRGGAIALLRAAQDDRVKKCATWSSVSNLEQYLEMKDFRAWKEDGVHEIINRRTHQKMPIFFQFVEAFAQNASTLSLSQQFENISCPLLIVHGENDDVVPISEAHFIYTNISHAILLEIENGDHTFNSKHPLKERKISKPFAEAVTETIEFFKL